MAAIFKSICCYRFMASRSASVPYRNATIKKCCSFNLLGVNPPKLAAWTLWMSEHVHKSHNVSVLMYHLVIPAKYRRVVFDGEVDAVIRKVCLEIEKRYEIKFLEIGIDRDHVHFLVQSVPTNSVTKVVRTIKSVTAREVCRRSSGVKKQLWGGEFWSDGYFATIVGEHGDEQVIARCVQGQGSSHVKG